MYDKKERIMLCARAHFMEQGFSNVSMDEIARECGVGKATIYKYFDSKEELMTGCIRLTAQKIGTVMDGVLSDERLNPAQKLAAIMRPLHETLSRVRPSAINDLRRNAPEAFRLIEEIRGKLLLGSISRLVSDGQKSGAFRNDINPLIITSIVEGSIARLAEPAVMAEFELTPIKIIGSVVSVIMEGCLTDAGRAEMEDERCRGSKNEYPPFPQSE